MKTKITFEEYLKKDNLAENSIESYLWTVNYFTTNYEQVSSENLLAYKGFLMEHFKPKTVNLRIQAMNKYLDYLEKPQLRLKAVKIQQKSFLENVISNADYKFLKYDIFQFVLEYFVDFRKATKTLETTIFIKYLDVQYGFFQQVFFHTSYPAHLLF